MIQTHECSTFLHRVYSRNFQEIVRFLWQPKCCYLLHSTPNRQMRPIQSQLNLVATVIYYFPSMPGTFPSSFPTRIRKAFLISHMIATYLIHPMPLDLRTSQCLVNNTFYDALHRLHFTTCYLGPVFCLPVCFDSQFVLRHSGFCSQALFSQTLTCSQTLSLFTDSHFVLRHSGFCSQTLGILFSDTLFLDTNMFSDTQSVLRHSVCSQTASLFSDTQSVLTVCSQTASLFSDTRDSVLRQFVLRYSVYSQTASLF